MKKLIFKSVLLSIILLACDNENVDLEQNSKETTALSSTKTLKARAAERFDRKLREKFDNDPDFVAQFNANEAFIKTYETKIAETTRSGRQNLPLYTLNIAVNILHVGANPLTRREVRRQIGLLNNAFSGTATTASSIPEDFRRSIAGDTRIRFELQRIRYRQIPEPLTDERDLFLDTTGGIDPLNSSNTINIYVSTSDAFTFGPISGSAPFANTSPDRFDHIFIDTTAFGLNSSDQLANRGDTLIHEMGHYLNLFHLVGPERRSNRCSEDDFIGDTPNGSRLYFLLENEAILGPSTSSCGSQDMYMNFMGNSEDIVLQMFTIGQRNRMRATLEPGGSRSNFVQSEN